LSIEQVTVVTPLRSVRDGRTLLVLMLAGAGGRPATLGPESLANLVDAIDEIDFASIHGLAICGTGATFCAGADLGLMVEAATLEESRLVARRGFDTLNRLRDLPVPVFAFINGTALGGGFELALRADYRTAAAGTKAIGLPEVRLGLIPGWGGLQSLAALVGPAAAAKISVTDSLAGRHLSAESALGIGVVDRVFPTAGFVEASVAFAHEIIATGEWARPWRESERDDWLAAIRLARESVDSRLLRAARAPTLALDVLALCAPGVSLEVQDEAAILAFGTALQSQEARASIYAFQLSRRKISKAPELSEGSNRAIRKVGVVGAGLMASQLAFVFAQRLGIEVVLNDVTPERVDRGLAWVRENAEKLVARGKLTSAAGDELIALIHGSVELEIFRGCDVVIEAVFEDLAVKRTVFADIEPYLEPDALLLTNTSSLSISAMAAWLAQPERVLGFHFFNPVGVLPLVELVRTAVTSPSSLALAGDLAVRLGKTAVPVTDRPGFVVNRILTRLFCEVLELIDAGADPLVVDRALDPIGLPMTPLTLLGFIGPAVQLHICEVMQSAYPERFHRSPSLGGIVAQGLPGYLDQAGELLPEVQTLLPTSVSTPDSAKISAWLLRALAHEVDSLLEECVVGRAEDIDLCLILGANFPAHNGGLLPLLDRSGATAEVRSSNFLQAGIASPPKMSRI
jgi:3-hydroxyacyl-CoA dehydrogenase/enoyl-CoA hydratase/carnithine racemase